MAAFALIVLIFSFWSILGYALISALYTKRNLLQNALLAPVAGASATVLVITTLNCAGLPVRYGGPLTTALLAALSLWLLRRCLPVLPGRRLLPFAAVLLTAALATGYPLLRFGFDWVSYANEDMANYCLGAKLFLNHGQFAVPSAADIVGDRDASLLYWFLYVVNATRHGADLTLAWVLSMTGLSAHQAFMPVILAFHLVLTAASGALVLQSKKFRTAALLTCILVSLSALTTLGTLYQLFGQVTGLGALCGTCAVLLRRLSHRRSELVFAAILTAGTGAFYPEVYPFLGLSFIIYHAMEVARGKETVTTLFQSLWPLAMFVGFFLNVTLLVVGIMVMAQSTVGIMASDTSAFLFPYYLTPAGFAYLWGFRGISEYSGGATLDIGIVVGFILFALAAVSILWFAWRGRPVAVMSFVMMVAIFQLFRLRSDFGLFKIAMYLQPFFLGTLAIAWVQVYNRGRTSTVWRWVLAGILILVAGASARSQLYYTYRSLGDGGGGLVELPYASSRHLISQLKALPPAQRALVSDTSSVVLAKFEAWYQPVYFVSKDYLIIGLSKAISPWARWNVFYRIYGDLTTKLAKARDSHFTAESFDTHGALPARNHFLMRREALDSDRDLIESSTSTVVVNRRIKRSRNPSLITLVAQSTERNYLEFVSSEFGNSYYLAGQNRGLGRVSMYQIEGDYFFHGNSMASLGRESLFRVINGSPRVRMVLEYTASLNSDRDNRIPDASVIGDQRHLFGVQGRGSARLFSPPIRLQQIGRGQYVALDMGTWGWSFPERRSRIMKLYGNDVRADSRKIVGFARDISLIAEEEYASLNPPRAIQRFPDDLTSKDLEYCGIYEDGFVAESSYAVLKQSEDEATLVVTLAVPTLHNRAASTWAVLWLDGKEIARQPTASGSVAFKIPVRGIGLHRIELRFDRADNLPVPDGRPISAHVLYMGFQPNAAAQVSEGAAKAVRGSGIAK
jgi:hypothetical protein